MRSSIQGSDVPELPVDPPTDPLTPPAGDGSPNGPVDDPSDDERAQVMADAAIEAALGGHHAPVRPPLDTGLFSVNAPTEGFFGGSVLGDRLETDLHDHGTTFEPEILTLQQADLPERSAPGSRRRRSQLRRLGWGFWIAVAWVVLVVLVAIFANFLPIQNPDAQTCLTSGGLPNAGPSLAHWLGCDDAGRDVFARVVFGSRVSLVVGFASIAMALSIGGLFGIIAGFIRGIFDSVSSVVSNVILAFPYLVLGLAITSFWGHDEFNVIVIIAIVATAPLYRVVRANTIAFTERDYVLAATALGSTRWRILRKQILPDVIPTAITYGFVGIAIAIIGEGALSFVGQSVPAPTPTWGNMILEGSTQIPSIGSVGVAVNVWLLLGPAIAMFLFILAINFIGDRLRSLLDVRESVL
jgi:peptide/nickel transport system permease protein